MCLGMGFFGFIMFGIHSASWICRLMSFAILEKFSVIISLNPLSAIVSCFLFWNFDVTNVGSSIIDTQILEILFLFACFLMFYFCLFSFSCWDCVKSIIIFSFTNSIISHLHSTIDLIQYLKRRRQWLPTPVVLPGQWTEEPGGLQSMGSLGVRHDWATSLYFFTFMHWRRKWQPTPAFLPGESQGWGSLVGCSLCGRTESDMTEAT